MKTHKIKTVEELVCCIAETPRLKIAISHNSIAAQDGDYNNPRVLILQETEKPEPNGTPALKSAFSINSGKEGYHQKDAVEMMVNEAGKLSFVDIDFANGSPHMSGRNPEACMVCHGNGGKIPPQGPRTIFDIAPWPRFVEQDGDPSRMLFGVDLCPGRNKLEPLLKQKALQALQTNPRYHCIKDKPLMDLAGLDLLLSNLNVPRIIKFLQASKDYNKFKYAIFGSQRCLFKPEDFIPQNVLQTMTRQAHIDPKIKHAKSVEELAGAVDELRLRLQQEANIRDQAKAKLIDKIKRNEKIDLNTDLKDTKNCGRGIFRMKDNMALVKQVHFQSNNIVYNRYDAQARADGNHGEVVLRFLFESRGIDISDWNMQPTGGGDRGFNLGEVILKSEPQNSPLRKLSQKFSGPNGLIEFDKQDQFCKELAGLSMRAFGGSAENSTADKSKDIIQ